MPSTFILVAVIVVVAIAFDYTNGFHDAANAIATSITTKALRPRAALAMAALGNLAGAFISTSVAATVGKGIIDVTQDDHGLVVVMAALFGAIAWNLITWWLGLPSSSSHALIGGLVGSAIAASQVVHWDGVTQKVVVPMVVSPIVGFTLSFVAVLALQWLFRNARRSRINGTFRGAQVLAAGAMSLGHGLQDAQKSMGVITLALVVGGYDTGGTVPDWVKIACATAIAFGTYAGGWRIMKTLGSKMIEMDPIRSTGSQGVASLVLYVMALRYAAPISTTHAITASILGAGATRGRKWVRWGVVGNIVGAWVLTLPAAAVVAALMYGFLRLLGLGG